MKHRSNRLTLIGTVCAMALAAACSETPTLPDDAADPVDTLTTPPPQPPVASVSLSQELDTLTSLWISLQVEFTALDSAGNEISNAELSWTSSDTSVVWVDSNGRVTALGNGTSVVVAASDGASDSCTVVVFQIVRSIELYEDPDDYPDTLELTAVNETFRAVATARDSVGNVLDNTPLTWRSSQPGIATVDTSGLVTAVANGTTELSLTAQQVTARKMLAVRAGVRILWAYDLEDPVRSGPAIAPDGTIHVLGFKWNHYSILPDGTANWKFFLAHMWSFTSAAVGADGAVYVGSTHANFYALNSDGTERWRMDGRYPGSSPAIGTDGTVYVVSNDSVLRAVSPDGSERWSRAFSDGNSAYSSPSLGSDGTLYLGWQDSTLYAINADGTLKWSFSASDEIHTSPAINSDGSVHFGTIDGILYAVDSTGIEKWQYATRGRVLSSPAIGQDGTIYIGSNDSTLHAVNPDGTAKWRYATGHRVKSSPALASNGTIYVGSDDGYLYAVDPNGALEWRFRTKSRWRRGGYPTHIERSEVAASVAIADDGTIYVCTYQERCYALAELAGSNGGLADSPWPKFRHDNRNTGNSATP